MRDELIKLVDNLDKRAEESEEIMKKGYFLRGIDAYRSQIHINNVTHDLTLILKTSPPPRRVLDFGCGFGIQSAILAQKGYDVIGLETVEDKSLDHFFKGEIDRHRLERNQSLNSIWKWLKKSQTSLAFKTYDGKNIPYEDSFFDLILAYAVLEHIPEEELPSILRELKRVLKINGHIFIFQFPRAESYAENIAHFLGLEAHEFLLTEEGIVNLITDCGFKITTRYRSDLLIKRPKKIVNFLFPILRPVEGLLLKTPLSYFAHHLNLIAINP